MFIINTKNDIERLRSAGWLSQSVKVSVEDLFDGLSKERNIDSQPEEIFSVEPEGTIAILEPGEPFSTIFTTVPTEYAEPFASESDEAYRIGVMLDNDRITQYIVLKGILNDDDKELLEQMVAESGCIR